MKKISLALALSGVVIGGSTAFAQHVERCGNDLMISEMAAADPGFMARHQAFVTESNAKADAYAQSMQNSAQKTTATVTIPIIFHVELTQSQIDDIGGIAGIYKRANSQLAVLNADYNARNADTIGIPAPFKPLLGNMNIIFSFAHRKPDGTATDGIEIKVLNPSHPGFTSSTAGSDSAKKASKSGLDPYDNTKYLNIWVTNIVSTQSGGKVLGFAYSHEFAYSLNPNFIDNAGVVLDYSAFGRRSGFADNTYYTPGADLGRTLVHELGHFFGLWHIWGNTNIGMGSCDVSTPAKASMNDDGISDTPLQKDATTSCQTFPYTDDCTKGNGIMFMNYMDYPGDACYKMFTKGQVTKMQSTIAPSTKAYGLTQHPELLAWPTSVTDIEKKAAIELFPNPSTGMFTISYNPMSSNLKEVRVVNMTGQVIKTIRTNELKNISNISVDMSNSAKGIYMIQCQFEEGIVVRKITLQ